MIFSTAIGMKIMPMESIRKLMLWSILVKKLAVRTLARNQMGVLQIGLKILKFNIENGVTFSLKISVELFRNTCHEIIL